MSQTVLERINETIEVINAQRAEYSARHGFVNCPLPPVEYEKLQTRFRIYKADPSNRSVYCFVDFEGNIYKAAGWGVPAKGVRGNIFDENCSWGKGLDVHGAVSRR